MKKSFFLLMLFILVAAGCKPKDPNQVDAEPYTLCDSIYLENEYEKGYSQMSLYERASSIGCYLLKLRTIRHF